MSTGRARLARPGHAGAVVEAGASTQGGGDGSSGRVGTGVVLGAAVDDDGRKIAYRGRK